MTSKCGGSKENRRLCPTSDRSDFEVIPRIGPQAPEGGAQPRPGSAQGRGRGRVGRAPPAGCRPVRRLARPSPKPLELTSSTPSKGKGGGEEKPTETPTQMFFTSIF